MSFLWLELILDRPVDAAIAFTVGVNSMGAWKVETGFVLGRLFRSNYCRTSQPTTGSRIHSMSIEDERFRTFFKD